MFSSCIYFDEDTFLQAASTLVTQSLLLMALRKKPLKNVVGKGENAGCQQFSPFSRIFYSLSKTSFKFFSKIFVLIVVCKINASSLDQSKILLFGRELNLS